MENSVTYLFQDYFERSINRGIPYHGRYYKHHTIDELLEIEDLGELSIQQVIAKSIADFGVKYSDSSKLLRPDAKVFLMLNYTNMVYYPLAKSKGSERFTLKNDIYDDIQTILSEAIKDQVEISSHRLLEIGLKLWSGLKTVGRGSW